MSSSVKVHNKSKEERDFERKIGCFLASSSEIFEREGSLKKTWWVGKWYLPSPKLKIYHQGCYTLLNSRLIYICFASKKVGPQVEFCIFIAPYLLSSWNSNALENLHSSLGEFKFWASQKLCLIKIALQKIYAHFNQSVSSEWIFEK